MPLFNYKCEKCQKEFEELVFSSKEKVYCKYCKSDQVTKKLPSKISSGSQGYGSPAPRGGST